MPPSPKTAWAEKPADRVSSARSQPAGRRRRVVPAEVSRSPPLSPKDHALLSRLAAGQLTAAEDLHAVHSTVDLGRAATVASGPRTLDGCPATVVVSCAEDMLRARARVADCRYELVMRAGAVLSAVHPAVAAVAAFEGSAQEAGSVEGRWTTEPVASSTESAARLLLRLVQVVWGPTGGSLMFLPPPTLTASRTVRVAGGVIRASCTIVDSQAPALWGLPGKEPPSSACVVVLRCTRRYDGLSGTVLLGPCDLLSLGALPMIAGFDGASAWLHSAQLAGVPPINVMDALLGVVSFKGANGGGFTVVVPHPEDVVAVPHDRPSTPPVGDPHRRPSLGGLRPPRVHASRMVLSFLDVASGSDSDDLEPEPAAVEAAPEEVERVVVPQSPQRTAHAMMVTTPVMSLAEVPPGAIQSPTAASAAACAPFTTPASKAAASSPPGSRTVSPGNTTMVSASTRSATESSFVAAGTSDMAVESVENEEESADGGVMFASPPPPPPPTDVPDDDLQRWGEDMTALLRSKRKADARALVRRHGALPDGHLSSWARPELPDDRCRWSVAAILYATSGPFKRAKQLAGLVARWKLLCAVGSVPRAFHVLKDE